VVIEVCHLALLARLLAQPLNRDKREGKRNIGKNSRRRSRWAERGM
jgi:hypothetical protein